MSDLDNFRKLGISEITLEALRRKGFEEPSPIQEQTIPRLLAGDKDIIGQAQTGTGKTAAFGIPILEVVERGDGDPGALILSPTRELSIQNAEEPIQPIIAVQATALIADLGQPGPDLVGRRVNRDRPGVLIARVGHQLVTRQRHLNLFLGGAPAPVPRSDDAGVA